MCWLRLQTIGGMLVVRVDFSGEVRIPDVAGAIPLFVTVTDDKAGLLLPETLMFPGDVIPLSGSYYPLEANGGEVDPCYAMFSDTFTAVGTSPLIPLQEVTEMVTATCPLCPCD